MSELWASEFRIEKLEKDAGKNWDKFYLRNKDHFFKDRNWSVEDMKLLCSHLNLKEALVYLEAGCGVGNMLFPISLQFNYFRFYGFDLSVRAVTMLQERASSLGISVETCVFDLTNSNCSKPPEWPLANITTLIFVLSSISPANHLQAIQTLKKFVDFGGVVLVRDYGDQDHAMVRFGRGALLSDRFYARQDGTRVFYFKLEELDNIFKNAGFAVRKSEYLHRKTINRKKGLSVDRIFVQGVYEKVN
uniref:Methyltransferase-like protein n=1 Tax=Syphacia muris TaxID=451379 RepID=A0A0N5AWT4_9BILA